MPDSPGKITLWGIEIFIATADEGSISAAARRVGASASAVSQQLTSLEAAVGATLLNRSTRPVSLTPAGAMFRRRAQVIQNEAEQARAELATSDLSTLTSFRLGMIEDFDADVTPALLSDMATDLSHCQFLLETGASHKLFGLLDSRALDVIVAADMGAAASWMEVHPLMEEPFIAAVPKGLVSEGLQGADFIDALGELPLIQYTARHVMGRVIAAHLARQNLRLSHRFELDSYHAIMAMVTQGAGWTILTPLGFLRAQRFHDGLDLFPLPFAPLARTISLHARQDVLGDMPGQVAERLRGLLQQLTIEQARLHMPWLGDSLRLL
ncbi:LysR family transcriptional regulator [Thalassobius sp. I31.1]|uniref:LysR family transcriptional regulator n=1 Tax=Thalassobius sp. I31.1 TaxID=2109912 RepID=UPI000D19E7CB|nr:LysR family transcriptional regulator [Thalassobius sp. I31.1]